MQRIRTESYLIEDYCEDVVDEGSKMVKRMSSLIDSLNRAWSMNSDYCHKITNQQSTQW